MQIKSTRHAEPQTSTQDKIMIYKPAEGLPEEGEPIEGEAEEGGGPSEDIDDSGILVPEGELVAPDDIIGIEDKSVPKKIIRGSPLGKLSLKEIIKQRGINKDNIDHYSMSTPKAMSIPTTALLPFPKFPWPPPKASGKAIIPQRFLFETESEPIYLCDIDMHISSALERAKYFEKSYFAVPDGFALVTRLEQINDDGTPKAEPQRWASEVGPLREFSLAAYLRALFTSNVGYFRVIVFIVTHYPFSQADIRVDRKQAIKWLGNGLNKLPRSIGESLYSIDYSCTALIYEFEKSDSEKAVKTKIPGRLSGRTHLVKSQLWSQLER